MYKACQSKLEDWSENHLQVTWNPETVTDESENKNIWTEEERGCLQSSMSGLWYSMHRGDWKVTVEETDWTQICCEDQWQEEWDCCTCMGHGPPTGLGGCWSSWVWATLLEEKSAGSHLDSEDTTQLQSGLWTDTEWNLVCIHTVKPTLSAVLYH